MINIKCEENTTGQCDACGSHTWTSITLKNGEDKRITRYCKYCLDTLHNLTHLALQYVEKSEFDITVGDHKKIN